MSIQLSDQYLALLRSIIAKHVDVANHQPMIFGSRAAGTAHKYSDVDLGFLGDTPLDRLAISLIEEDLEESDLPYMVDVVDFATVEDSFKRVALGTYKEI